MEKNLAVNATPQKCKKEKRKIWNAETAMYALDVCEDEKLKLAINLAFSYSLRMGELLGLTWDCVDISEEATEEERAFIFINKEAIRVEKEAIAELNRKGILLIFSEKSTLNKTVLVLKNPKTESSVRKVFLPTTVANKLIEWKKKQDEMKEVLEMYMMTAI